MNPFTCSDKIQSCNAYLYQHNGHQVDEIASLYSVNASEIKAIAYAGRQDYLVPVNCRCENVNGTQGQGYFYDVVYEPKQNDIFYNVSEQCFSGQVWSSGVDTNLKFGLNKTLYLLCGCVDNDSQLVVTYTVQPADTLSSIASLLSAEVDGIQKLNTYVTNPSFIQAGWLLYVPMEKYGLSGQDKGEHHFSFIYPASVDPLIHHFPYHFFAGAIKVHKWILVVGLLSAVTLLSICTLAIILVRRNRSRRLNEEDPKSISKNSSTRTHSLHRQYTHRDMEGQTSCTILYSSY